MNYQAAYDNLIRTRKQRVPVKGAYYENHHVIMKSMGGSDEPENLVRLTAREHFLAHWLLWRIHRNESSAYAFWSMCQFKNRKTQGVERKTSSRMYAESKDARRIFVSEKMKETQARLRKDETYRKKISAQRSFLRRGVKFTRKQIESTVAGRAKSFLSREKEFAEKWENSKKEFLEDHFTGRFPSKVPTYMKFSYEKLPERLKLNFKTFMRTKLSIA